MAFLILGVRFALEVTAIAGILIGGFQQKHLKLQVLYILLAIMIVGIWSVFGSPKSPHKLKGFHKFLLEILVYSIVTISFYKLFSQNTALVFILFASLDLLAMYSFGIQE